MTGLSDDEMSAEKLRHKHEVEIYVPTFKLINRKRTNFMLTLCYWATSH